MAPEAGAPAPTPRKRRDLRLPALALVVAGIVGLGYLVTLLPSQPDAAIATREHEARRAASLEDLAPEAARDGNPEAEAAPADPRTRQQLTEVRQLLNGGNYDQALERLNASRPEIQHLPEAYVLVGNALLGKKDYRTAGDFFLAAIDRDPTLADGYYGAAVAAEGLGDLKLALGGMRSYLHLQTDPDPYRRKVAQARAAIWEWETRLGRGEWGRPGVSRQASPPPN